MTSTRTHRPHHAGHPLHPHRDRQDWWVPIFRGGWLLIVAAFALYASPSSLLALSLLFATAAFISAGVLLTNGYALRSPLPMIQGALSLAVAGLVAFLPHDRWGAIILIVGLWSIAMGAIDLLMVQRHRHMRGRAFLFAAGALSVGGGLLGAAAARFHVLPLAAFAVLTLVAGGSLIGYGMRRRRSRGRVAAVNAAHRDEERRLEEAHVS